MRDALPLSRGGPIPPPTPGLSVLPPTVVLFQVPRAQAGGVPSPRAETPPGQLIIGVAVPCRTEGETTGSEASGGNQVEPAKSPHPRCSPRTLNLHSGQVCWSISQGSTQSRWNSCLQGSTRSHCGGRGGRGLRPQGRPPVGVPGPVPSPELGTETPVARRTAPPPRTCSASQISGGAGRRPVGALPRCVGSRAGIIAPAALCPGH